MRLMESRRLAAVMLMRLVVRGVVSGAGNVPIGELILKAHRGGAGYHAVVTGMNVSQDVRRVAGSFRYLSQVVVMGSAIVVVVSRGADIIDGVKIACASSLGRLRSISGIPAMDAQILRLSLFP